MRGRHTAKPKLTRSKLRRKWRANRSMGVPSAVDLIEEGVHLLRSVSLVTWAVYLCGMAPFLVGFLFFWTEMANSGVALHFLVPGSIGLTVLFFVLKLCQIRFAQGLKEAHDGVLTDAWSFADWCRIIKSQLIFQGAGLILLPIASVITFPFAWLFTWYQNLMLLDFKTQVGAKQHSKQAWSLARMWHEENWLLLSLLTIVAFLTFLNCLSAVFLIPFLLRTLFGIETVFSRAGGHIFDSSVLFACALLTYAMIDPLVKVVYFLRLHYAESRGSGIDLQRRLKQIKRRRSGIVPLAVICGTLLVGSHHDSEASELTVGNSQVSAAELDGSIDSVMSQREFIWRFPRDAIDGGVDVPSWYTKMIDALKDWRERFERWIESIFENDKEKRNSEWNWDGISGIGPLLSYLLIGAFVLLVVYLAIKAWKSYQPIVVTHGASEPLIDVVPDLNDEEVLADALPRNEWIDLARELIGKGEFRLALRAYFLAQLSALSAENLIIIRPAKSNREYADELTQRGHGQMDLVEVYGEQVRLFESVWYGDRTSGASEVGAMEGYLQKTGVLG